MYVPLSIYLWSYVRYTFTKTFTHNRRRNNNLMAYHFILLDFLTKNWIGLSYRERLSQFFMSSELSLA